MTRSQISDLKTEFIRKQQELMKKSMSSAEKRLYTQIYDSVIDKLDLSGSSINSNGKNIKLSAEIDGIFREFNKKEYTNILKKFASDLNKIADLNSNYFKKVIDDKAVKRFDSVTKEVKAFTSKRIGIGPDNTIESGGYLDRLIKDEAFKKKIKAEVLKGVTNKIPVENLIKKLQTSIIGSPDIDGGLVKNFNQYMHDTYNRFDRTTSKQYAVKLGLRFFIYQGGRIKTSREFCINHDNKCYTTDEAEKWKYLIGTDKGPIADKDTYSPLIDCGGYGCRHSIDYISDSLARRYRPELFD